MEQQLKKKILGVLVEDSFLQNEKQLSEESIEKMIDILCCDYGVVYENGIRESYNVSLTENALLIDDERFDSWDEIESASDISTKIDEVLETSTSLDTISALLGIPEGRFHSGLTSTSPTYESLLDEVYEASEPYDQWVEWVDVESPFTAIYERDEFVRETEQFLEEWMNE